ncbi:phosphoglyceromutase [Actinobacillus pleuropneumoniae]|nr:phosphoglyceromutase [Actinobacillus pleuropneumoniae]
MTNKFTFGVALNDISPPDLDAADPNSAHNDRRYAHLPKDVIPNAENLKITLERVLPFWEDQIAPALLSGKRVLVTAHGNSLRALAKHIIGISDAEIMDFEIPTGQPLVLKLDDKLNFVEKFYL